MAQGSVVATSAWVADHLAAAGVAHTVDTAPSHAVLAAAEVVALEADWAALRAWRAAGLRSGALVLLDGHALPEDRTLLEPLAIVQRPTPSLVAEAVASLAAGSAPGTLALTTGTLDLARRELIGPAGHERLSQREVDLLAYLSVRTHRDVGRDELQVQVWGHARASANTRAIDMAVARLRKKIEADPARPVHLITSRGGGYQLQLHPQATATLTQEDEEARAQLETLEMPFSLDAAAAVLGGDRLDAADHLEALLDAGVVRRVEGGFVVGG